MAKGKGGFIGQDGLNAPDAPTQVSGEAGDEQVTVSFTSPTDTGASAITSYRVRSNSGIGASGSSSPITVTGLTNGTSYTFNVWAINTSGWSAPSDASGSISPIPAPIGLVSGGEAPSAVNTINYKDISTTGNFSDFGDLTSAQYKGANVASATRAVFAHGQGVNTMSYVTPQTTGNSVDFGDRTYAQSEFGGSGNSTYGYFFAGSGYKTNIDYITIASTGNAANFGSLNVGIEKPAGFASTTRAFCTGGDDNSLNKTIQYWTIGTSGSASDFGDLTVAHANTPAGFSSQTRGVTAAGSGNNVIEYVTMSTTGNGTDFGDLSANVSYGPAGLSSYTRGLFAGGAGWTNNTIEYITIATTGNSQDFGDLAYSPQYHPSGTSTQHGGVS